VCISIAAVRTTKALRQDFLKQTLRQNVAFFDSPDSGSISIQVTTNGNIVQQGIAERLSLTIQALTTFIAAFVVAFAIQWKLTLITLCIVPTILIVTTICVIIETRLESRILPIYSRAGALAEEVFSSMRTVHSFWLQPLMSKRYDDLLAEANRIGLHKSPNYGVLFSSEFFCIFCGYALAFWEGMRMYTRGEVHQVGTVVT
jgi:ATP-binding cassette, subfamily B (MDR/TAP), member 1